MAAMKPHVMAVAVPAQGHVKPLMNLCRQIAQRGIKVTFVNAQSIHDKIVAAANTSDADCNIELASVPDGLEADADPNEPFMLLESLKRTMPLTLKDLIHSVNRSNPSQQISCMIVDLSFGWVMEIAEDMGIESVGFSVTSMASSAVILRIPELVEAGILDENGSLTKGDEISLSNGIPSWRKDEFPWSTPSDMKIQKMFFECVKEYNEANKAKWLLCNACYELEPAACDLYPNFLPVGPLHEPNTNTMKPSSNPGSFKPTDSSCLRWLDGKPAKSVIYVSFGSFASFSQQQLDELATGLELSGRAFLWVVRPDLADGSRFVYPKGFLERVGELGKIVEWAPQNEVLSHPSVGCFLSHCGWNSTLEGVSNGVPFLCWSYFADQFHNESCICDVWGTGLRIEYSENESVRFRSKYEIEKKIEMIFCDNKWKENALKVKEMCRKSISDGGSTSRNFEMFIDNLRK